MTYRIKSSDETSGALLALGCDSQVLPKRRLLFLEPVYDSYSSILFGLSGPARAPGHDSPTRFRK